jgi:hypothetical protein
MALGRGGGGWMKSADSEGAAGPSSLLRTFWLVSTNALEAKFLGTRGFEDGFGFSSSAFRGSFWCRFVEGLVVPGVLLERG